jgi:hypothetical protein
MNVHRAADHRPRRLCVHHVENRVDDLVATPALLHDRNTTAAGSRVPRPPRTALFVVVGDFVDAVPAIIIFMPIIKRSCALHGCGGGARRNRRLRRPDRHPHPGDQRCRPPGPRGALSSRRRGRDQPATDLPTPSRVKLGPFKPVAARRCPPTGRETGAAGGSPAESPGRPRFAGRAD